MEIYSGSEDLENYMDVDCGNILLPGHPCGGYKLRMLLENELPHVIRPVQNSIDRELYLRFYTGSAGVLARLLLGMKPDGAFLRLLLTQLAECLQALESHLLSPEDLVLSPDYILYDVKNRELRLIYVPGYGVDLKEQLKVVMELLLRRFDHRDREGMALLLEVYDKLESGAGMEELLSLKAGDGTDERTAVPEGKLQEPAVRAETVCLNTPKEQASEKDTRVLPLADEVPVHEKKAWTLRDAFFFASIGLMLLFITLFFASHGDQKYVILCIATLVVIILQMIFSAGKDPEDDTDEESLERIMEPYISCRSKSPEKLVPLKSGGLPEIVLKQEEQIVIGRGKKESDYRLPSAQVSRVHAVLRKSEDHLFLVDQGSSNGTFVNAERVKLHEVRALMPGDVVSFAGEEFFVS